MGIGIWSMHFLGMLAFSIPGVPIHYDILLLFLSILISVLASYLSLFLIAEKKKTALNLFIGSIGMGSAISGMHYVGIWSMRMPLEIIWDYKLVTLSILIAIFSSFAALFFAFKLRGDDSLKGFIFRVIAGITMGGAISSMHYVGTAAMSFIPSESVLYSGDSLLASDGLASAVFVGTIVILGMALAGASIDRSLERKNHLNKILQDSIKTRDDFLSIASHELKTPLTALRLQIGLIERKLNEVDLDKVKINLMLNQGQKSITQISRVVEEMLDIARISTGRFQLDKEEFAICSFISDLVERIRPSIEQGPNTIFFETENNIVGFWDKYRIEQVVMNLISNAAQYAKSSEIVVKLWKDGAHVKLSITDNGIGIGKEEHDKIFRRYERGESSKDYRGLGIGLYLVREIVLLHNGTIIIESELGKGSRFVVTLPLVT